MLDALPAAAGRRRGRRSRSSAATSGRTRSSALPATWLAGARPRHRAPGRASTSPRSSQASGCRHAQLAAGPARSRRRAGPSSPCQAARRSARRVGPAPPARAAKAASAHGSPTTTARLGPPGRPALGQQRAWTSPWTVALGRPATARSPATSCQELGHGSPLAVLVGRGQQRARPRRLLRATATKSAARTTAAAVGWSRPSPSAAQRRASDGPPQTQRGHEHVFDRAGVRRNVAAGGTASRPAALQARAGRLRRRNGPGWSSPRRPARRRPRRERHCRTGTLRGQRSASTASARPAR